MMPNRHTWDYQAHQFVNSISGYLVFYHAAMERFIRRFPDTLDEAIWTLR